MAIGEPEVSTLPARVEPDRGFEAIPGLREVSVGLVQDPEFLVESGIGRPVFDGFAEQGERVLRLVLQKQHHAHAGEDVGVAGVVGEGVGEAAVAIVDEI